MSCQLLAYAQVNVQLHAGQGIAADRALVETGTSIGTCCYSENKDNEM